VKDSFTLNLGRTYYIPFFTGLHSGFFASFKKNFRPNFAIQYVRGDSAEFTAFLLPPLPIFDILNFNC